MCAQKMTEISVLIEADAPELPTIVMFSFADKQLLVSPIKFSKKRNFKQIEQHSFPVWKFTLRYSVVLENSSACLGVGCLGF